MGSKFDVHGLQTNEDYLVMISATAIQFTNKCDRHCHTIHHSM